MTVRSVHFDRTRLTGRGNPLLTTRTLSRRLVVAATAWCALFGACRGSAVPNQVLKRAAPPEVTAPAEFLNGPWAYRSSTRSQRFVVDQRAVLTSPLDTSARPDTVSSHAEVGFAADPARQSVTGRVDVFLVKGTGRPAATPPGLTTPFPFRAEYSMRGTRLDFTAPGEVEPCASISLAVSQTLRDLWFRPPDTLRVGTSWEDSSAYVVCRDGIPLRVAVRRTFRVSASETREGRVVLQISRTARTTLEGAGTQFGENVAVSGTGSGRVAYDFDPVTGEVLRANGSATLDLSVRTRLRTQLVRQIVEVRVGRT